MVSSRGIGVVRGQFCGMNPAAFPMGGVVPLIGRRRGRRNMGVIFPTHPP
jgi:hypothetical protein